MKALIVYVSGTLKVLENVTEYSLGDSICVDLKKIVKYFIVSLPFLISNSPTSR